MNDDDYGVENGIGDDDGLELLIWPTAKYKSMVSLLLMNNENKGVIYLDG